MNSREDAQYRLKLAQEHLEDATFEITHSRWSKAALSCQLSVENSAKAVIALFKISVKSHDLAGDILDLRESVSTGEERIKLEELSNLAEKLGRKEHILTSYGDEVALKTPREIYDEDKAKKAHRIAKRAFELASRFGQAD